MIGKAELDNAQLTNLAGGGLGKEKPPLALVMSAAYTLV